MHHIPGSDQLHGRAVSAPSGLDQSRSSHWGWEGAHLEAMAVHKRASKIGVTEGNGVGDGEWVLINQQDLPHVY